MSSNGTGTPRTMVNSVIRALSSLTSGGRNSQANNEFPGGGGLSPDFDAGRSVSPEGQTQLGDLDLGARLRLERPSSEDLEEPLTSARMERFIGEEGKKKSESSEMSKPINFGGEVPTTIFRGERSSSSAAFVPVGQRGVNHTPSFHPAPHRESRSLDAFQFCFRCRPSSE